MQYQNIWIRDLEDGVMTFVMTLDLVIKQNILYLKIYLLLTNRILKEC